MSESITFEATIAKVQTTADMGLRVTLDLPEHAVMAAAELMAMRQAGAVLSVTCQQQQKQGS